MMGSKSKAGTRKLFWPSSRESGSEEGEVELVMKIQPDAFALAFSLHFLPRLSSLNQDIA